MSIDAAPLEHRIQDNVLNNISDIDCILIENYLEQLINNKEKLTLVVLLHNMMVNRSRFPPKQSKAIVYREPIQMCL